MKARFCLAVAGACAATFAMVCAVPASANPFEELKGSWRGGGSISPLGGAPERVSCRATYGGGSGALTQNLVCKAASFSLSINANMKVSNEKLSGSWSESFTGTNGSVSGLARGNLVLVRISGAKFNGRMNINVSKGSHSLSLNQTQPGSGKLVPVANISMSR